MDFLRPLSHPATTLARMDHGWQYTSAHTTLPDETWARALAADGWTTLGRSHPDPS